MKYPLSESDNGRTLELRLDDELDLSLRESRLSGYRWSLLGSGEPQLSCAEIAVPSNPAQLGQPNIRKWQFIAKEAGTTHILLRHARSWQPSSGSDFSITARVNPEAGS
jgi:predicted secreted protein